MKLSTTYKNFVLVCTLLLAASAFAAKGPLQVTEPISVGGTQLKPGDYTVSWEGSGPTVQLNIMKGSKVVTTVPAQVVAVDRSPGTNSTVAKQNGDGSKSLSQIRFSGKKYTLQIGEGMAGAPSGNSSKSNP